MTEPRASPGPAPGRLRRAPAELGGGLPRAYWWLWTGLLVNRVGGYGNRDALGDLEQEIALASTQFTAPNGKRTA